MHRSYTDPAESGVHSFEEIPVKDLHDKHEVWISCVCKLDGFHKIDRISNNATKEYRTVWTFDKSYDPAIKCRKSVIFYRHGTAIVKKT